VQILVRDIVGREWLRTTNQAHVGDQEFGVDGVNSLDAGSYFITVMQGNATATLRMMKTE
jgi:hypothetical protein